MQQQQQKACQLEAARRKSHAVCMTQSGKASYVVALVIVGVCKCFLARGVQEVLVQVIAEVLLIIDTKSLAHSYNCASV
jgi:hypothetical protein